MKEIYLMWCYFFIDPNKINANNLTTNESLNE